jgi:UDP-N-acetylglucosamine 1-carboxyvinyltransferase
MESFVIEGGKPLKGSITPQGAKNEVLQTLCAVLLSPDPIIINNIPDIIDVNKLINLLRNFGVKVSELDRGSYQFQSDAVNLDRESTLSLEVSGAVSTALENPRERCFHSRSYS